MSQYYTVSIPVKAHIEKFFRVREGSPIRSSDQSMIWLTVRPYLLYKPGDGLSRDQRNRQIEKLKGEIKLQLSINKVKLYGLQVKPSSVILMNMILDHYFGRELYWHVQSCEYNPGRYKGFKLAIENFCALYDIEIEEDISNDALLKIYQRQRDLHHKLIGAKKISPAKLTLKPLFH